MKLYELTTEFNFLRQYFDGDVSDEEGEKTFNKLNELSKSIKIKGTNIGLIIKEAEAGIEGLKKAEYDIKQRRTNAENKIKRLKEYLKVNMENAGISKIENAYLAIKIKNNPPAVDIFNEKILPQEYMEIKFIETPNKIKIKNDIKKGKEVPGATLKENTRIEVK